MRPIKLIVGLANPGPEYQNTRHNAGEWFVQELAKQQQISLTPQSKYFGHTGKVFIDNTDVHLLIPTTFMNLSGKAVGALANFYKILPEQILIAHDELDIDPGTARIKFGGSHGGHNGLRDIIQVLGNSKNFFRLRIGIGHPGHKSQVSNYVLSKPSISDRNKINEAIDESLRVIDHLAKGDLDFAQNQLHSFSAQ
jgi:peptidyl-tRNA hydrolase, PTH1 family